MAEIIYALCAMTSLLCAGLLFRGYRASRTPLLFWGFLCFAGLAVNNLTLFADYVLFPNVDLSLLRRATALVSIVVMLIGLVFESHGEARR